MSKICILTDSSAGFSQEELNNYEIRAIDLHIIINNEKDIRDNIQEIKKANLDDLIENVDVKTSKNSIGELETFYDSVLRDYDKAIFIPMAYKLSGQYETAQHISQQEKYKDKIIVVKSYATAILLKQMCIYGSRLIKEGKNTQEIIDEIINMQNMSMTAVTPGSIELLVRGGRSKSFLVGLLNLLRIKILINWSENTKKVDKSRTLSKLVNNIMEIYDEKIKKYKEKFVFYVVYHPKCKTKFVGSLTDELKKREINYKESFLAHLYCIHMGFNSFAAVAIPKRYHTD